MKLTIALLVLTFNESIGFSPTRSRPTFGIHSKSFQLNSFTNNYLDSLSSSAKNAIDNLESKFPSNAKNAIDNLEESLSSSTTHLIGDVTNSLSSSAKHLIDDVDIPPIPSSAKNIVENVENSIASSAKHAMENYSSHDMQKLLDSITTTTKSITTSRFSLDPALIDAKVLAASKFLEDMLPPAMQELKTKKYDFSNYFDEDGKSKIQVRSDSYFDADGNVVQSRFANVDEKSATTNDIPNSVQSEEITYEETQLGGDGQNMKDIGNNEMQSDSSDGKVVQQALEDPVVEDPYSIQTVESNSEISTQTPTTDGDNLNIQTEEIDPSVPEFKPETINNLDQQGQEMTQTVEESITTEDVMSGNEVTITNEPQIPDIDVHIEETTPENIVQQVLETDTTSSETQMEPAEVDQADTVSVEDNTQAPTIEDNTQSMEDADAILDVDAMSIETQMEPTEIDQTDTASVEETSLQDNIQSMEDAEAMPDVESISTETQMEPAEVDQADTVVAEDNIESSALEDNIQSMEDADTMPDVESISTETQMEPVEVDQADTVSIEETSPEVNIQSMEDADTMPDVESISTETQMEPAEVDQADTVVAEDNIESSALEDNIQSMEDADTMPDVESISTETQMEPVEVDQADTASVEETSLQDNIQSMEDAEAIPDVESISTETQMEPVEVDQAATVVAEDNIQASILEDSIDSAEDCTAEGDPSSVDNIQTGEEVGSLNELSDDTLQKPALEDMVQAGDETMTDADPIIVEKETEFADAEESIQNPNLEDIIQAGDDGDPNVNSFDTETQIGTPVVEDQSDLPQLEDNIMRVNSEDAAPPLLSNEGDSSQELQSENGFIQTTEEELDIDSMYVDKKSIDKSSETEDIFQMEQPVEESKIESDLENTDTSTDTSAYAESSASTVDEQSGVPDVETISQEPPLEEDFFESPEVPAVEFDSASENNMMQATENKFGSDLFDSNFDQNSAIDEFNPSDIDDSIAELDRRLAELQAEQEELERMAKQLVSQMKENINLETNSIEMFASDITSAESADATNIVNAIYNQDNTVTVSHSSTTSTLDANFENMKQNFPNMFQEFEVGNSFIDPNAAPALERATDVAALVASEAIVTESSGSMNENSSPRNDDNVLNDFGDDMFSAESPSVDEVMSSSTPATANEVEVPTDTMQPTTSAGQTSTSQKSSTLESSQNESFDVENSAMEKIDADINRNLEANGGTDNFNVPEVVETTSTDAVVSSSSPDTSIELESSRTMSVQDSIIAPSEEIRASTESQVIDKNPIENIAADVKATLETESENTDNIINVGKQVSKKIGDLNLPEAGEKIGNSVGKMKSKANKMEYDFSIDSGVQDQIPNAPSLKRIKLPEVTENSNKALTSMKEKFESVQGKVSKPFEEVQENFNTFKARNNAAFNLDQKVEKLKNNKITEEADQSFIGPIKEKIQNSLQSTREQDLAKQIEGALSNNLKKVDGTLSDNLKKVEGTLTGNLKQVEGTVSGNLKQVEGTLSSNVNQLEGAFSSNLKQVEKAVETNIKQVEGAITDDVSVINSKSSEILGKVADSEFVQQTSKLTKEVAESEAVKTGVKVAKDVGTTSAKAISTAVESEAVKGVTASLRSTADSITIRDIGNAFIAAIKFIGVLVLKILDSILETCNQESVAELFEDTRSAISNTATSMGKSLNEFTINGFDGESFSDVLRDIAGIVVQFTTAIGAIFTNILDIILEQSGADENASELLHHIQDSFVSLFQNIGDTSILEVIENIVGLVVAVANVIANLLSTGKDSVDAAITINGDVASGTDKLATLMESVGTEIVSSMDSINIPL